MSKGGKKGGTSRYGALLGKEMLELARSMKLVWVPLVFVALGIMQPVSIYYMPLILEHGGNLPEGTVIEMPMPLPSEVMSGTLSQFGVIGILVLVLVFMGVVSGERSSGTASLILVKPVSIMAYLGSKLTAMLLLALLSLLCGYLAAWYYTDLLIGKFAFGEFLGSFLLYGLWLAFAMAATLLFSTILRSSAGAAACVLVLLALLSIAANLAPHFAGWLPGALNSYAAQAANSTIEYTDVFVWVIVCTVLLIAGAYALSCTQLRNSATID
ncbi:ABC transporter permease [Paenibacillus agaridevorans]|uniref:ABC transporter permease n=1 Tax=Paenibacillus agaridevorans TaxID=171404 RepID=UPI001BE484D2|nr:ABC transporter permease subunit [Paenibacillus agaridevorans]